MRVALLHYSAPPVIGGVESIVGAHARLLRDAGHDVLVVAGRGDAEIVPELDTRHPAVEWVARELAQGRVDSDFEVLEATLGTALAELLADSEVVVAHNVLTMPFNLPAAAALVELGKPLVAWTHDIAWINPLYADYRREGEPWEFMRTAQRGTTYVTVSETRRGELAELFGLPPERIQAIPNGIDASAWAGLSADTVEFASHAGFLDADPLLLCPLRITPRKRLELAIEAAAVISSQEPNLKLVISGPLGAHSAQNAAYAEQLRDLVTQLAFKDKVIFVHQLEVGAGVHPVSDDQIAGLYRLADAVVLPSASEGFGLPVLEAGLAGTAVVCADIPVLREVSGGDAWFFAADADADTVAAVIAQALASAPSQLRRRARGYDWSRLLPRIEGVLEAAAGA